MSYDKDFGFECDDCGETIGGDPMTFMESKDIIDSEGWKTTRENGEYKHYCPKCRELRSI